MNLGRHEKATRNTREKMYGGEAEREKKVEERKERRGERRPSAYRREKGER